MKWNKTSRDGNDINDQSDELHPIEEVFTTGNKEGDERRDVE